MIKMILAVEKDHGIGLNNGLPWSHFKEDMQHFRKHTLNQTILMGKNTWDGFKSPLPNRRNVVLTTKPVDDVETVNGTPEEVISVLCDDFIVIGGANVYMQYKDVATEIILTRIDQSYQHDTKIDLDGLLEGYVLALKEEYDGYSFEYWRK